MKVLGCTQPLCITSAASSHSPELEGGHVHVAGEGPTEHQGAQVGMVQLLATPRPAQIGRPRY